jgi:hypothetical protein
MAADSHAGGECDPFAFTDLEAVVSRAPMMGEN